MTILLQNMIIYLLGKWMIISFNLSFKGKKSCVIKEAVANKRR